MHNPIGPGAFRGPTAVENKGLLHPDSPGAMANGSILPSSFPVPFFGSPIRPGGIPILPVQQTEEVPLRVPALQLRLP